MAESGAEARCICIENIEGNAMSTARLIDGRMTGAKMSRGWACPEHGSMRVNTTVRLTFPRAKKVAK